MFKVCLVFHILWNLRVLHPADPQLLRTVCPCRLWYQIIESLVSHHHTSPTPRDHPRLWNHSRSISNHPGLMVSERETDRELSKDSVTHFKEITGSGGGQWGCERELRTKGQVFTVSWSPHQKEQMFSTEPSWVSGITEVTSDNIRCRPSADGGLDRRRPVLLWSVGRVAKNRDFETNT